MKLTSIVLSIYLYSAKLSLLRFGVSLVMLIILSTSSNLVFAQHLSVEEIDTLINESFAIRTSDLNSLARNIDSLEAHNDLLSPFQRQNLTFLIAHLMSN